MKQSCSRCRQETSITTMSYFNTDVICLKCSSKERNHPKFKEAQDKEMEEVRKGNMKQSSSLTSYLQCITSTKYARMLCRIGVDYSS